MPCETCGEALTTGLEIRLRTCVDCAEHAIQDSISFKEAARLSEQKCMLIESHIKKYLEAVTIQTSIQEAQKIGGLSHGKGSTLDDNPYDPDSDESACWSYGWLQADLMAQANKAGAVLSWTLGMLSVVRELVLGGAQLDEISAKIEAIVEKIEPYIPTA